MMKANPITIVLTCLAATASLSGCHKSHRPTAEPPARVEVMAAQKSPILSSRTYSGTVQESSGADLSFELGGMVNSVSVNQGDWVSRGQVIATLDRTSLEHTYQIAKTALDEAQDVYNRMKKLHDSKSIPDMKWVEVENSLRTAQNTEAIARKTLSDATLRAPFAGYISQRHADAGTVTAPALPVARLVVIDPVKVNVAVAETDIGKVNEGQRAVMTIASMPGKTFTGQVTERGVSADLVSRTYDVKVTIANPAHELLPGMICDLKFENTDSTTAIVLPYDAVLLDAANSNFVWTVRGDTAVKRVVKVADMLDNGLSIAEGLSVGDTVIVAGQQKVSEGGKVEIVKR